MSACHIPRSLQTDGWLSEKSASIYEASTETLFLGRQDAMQRQSLVPLHNFLMQRGGGRQHTGENVKMLEVACGTGRFATFVKVSCTLFVVHQHGFRSCTMRHTALSYTQRWAASIQGRMCRCWRWLVVLADLPPWSRCAMLHHCIVDFCLQGACILSTQYCM